MPLCQYLAWTFDSRKNYVTVSMEQFQNYNKMYTSAFLTYTIVNVLKGVYVLNMEDRANYTGCPYCRRNAADTGLCDRGAVHSQDSSESETGTPPSYQNRIPGNERMPGYQSGMMENGIQPGYQRRMPGNGMQPDYQPGMPGNGMQPDYQPEMPGNGMQPDYQPGMPGNGMQPDYQPGMPGNGMQPDYQPGVPGNGMQPGYNPFMPGNGMQPGYSPFTPGNGMQPDYRPGMPGQQMPMGPGPAMPPFSGTEQTPLPYYQAYGYPVTFMEEQENERDMQRLKEMYPEVARDILKFVEEECDKMEYEGSMMFDEQPDRVMLSRLRDGIYDKVKDNHELTETDDKDEVFVMNQETRRRYPPNKNWLNDLIEVLLFQEMYRRRCRHRNCRRWY